MRVVTAQQMRDADAAAVARVGDVALMRAAGDAIVRAMEIVRPGARRIVAFAGPGNNGGDAYAALAVHPSDAERVVYAMPAAQKSAGRRDAERRARDVGVHTQPFPVTQDDARRALAGADLALDAMLGTGARVDLPEPMRAVSRALRAAGAPVIAIDIPTGIDATTGAADDDAIRARATVTLGAPKLGLLLEPARERAGEVFVGDLGILDEIAAGAGDAYAALDDAAFLALLPRRHAESDKRRSGAPLVIAGSERFPGAGVLCTLGAARTGAGYVTVGIGSGALATLRAHLIEQVAMPYDARDPATALATLRGLTAHASAVAIGPGLETDDATAVIVRGFLAELDLPFVADAGALTVLRDHLEILRGKRCVLTPHESEFARIDGGGPIAPGTRVERLRAFVERTGITTLLKGNATLVYDGRTMHVNTTGTNALATAGTGDVLTGVVATLLSQGLAPVDAARAGAYWHGLSARYVAKTREVGIIASDVANALGFALPSATASERESANGPGSLALLVPRDSTAAQRD